MDTNTERDLDSETIKDTKDKILDKKIDLEKENKVSSLYSKFEAKKDFAQVISQSDFIEFQQDKQQGLFKNNTYGLNVDDQLNYIKILYYVQNLAKNYTYEDIRKPENKEAFENIKILRDMNNDLGGIPDTIKFKESHETQTINTMADVYHHTDALVQDKKSGFQDYIQHSATTNKETATYKKDKLKDKDFLKLYPKRLERQQDRQRTNPEWFDPYTKQFDLSKVDEQSKPMVEEKYNQTMKYGQEFLKNLDQQTQKSQKDYVMLFVLKEFSKLFMVSSSYDASHLGYDFALNKIQSTPNGTVRIEGKLGSRKMGMDYSLATGELRVDDFLYQQFPEGNFSIDPESPGKYKLNGRLARFDEQYQRKPKIDLTQIIQEENDPIKIQTKAQEYLTKTFSNNYKSTKNGELQSQVMALVEKNKIVQDRLDIFVPGAVESMVKFGGVNNADEQPFRNMLKIRHNTIENSNPSYLAHIGKAMNQLAGFCQQLQGNATIRNNFEAGATDQLIKDKIFALSKEGGNLDSIQRGKAFADLVGTTTGGLLVEDGKLQAGDIQTLVATCKKSEKIDPDLFSQNFKTNFYDNSPLLYENMV